MGVGRFLLRPQPTHHSILKKYFTYTSPEIPTRKTSSNTLPDVGAPTFLVKLTLREILEELLWDQRADFLNHEIDADLVVAALRNNYVGVALGRLHEFHMHGPDRGHVLFDHRFGGAAALADVAPQPANEAQVGLGIDENLDVAKIAKAGILKYQNTFND